TPDMNGKKIIQKTIRGFSLTSFRPLSEMTIFLVFPSLICAFHLNKIIFFSVITKKSCQQA
ncbi:hypothetical protein, partial [Escherichia coli]|uniref:hypothetical protein n=1 Tax=Escherichia coli TaxID=562 RepID=UPI001BB4826A